MCSYLWQELGFFLKKNLFSFNSIYSRWRFIICLLEPLRKASVFFFYLFFFMSDQVWHAATSHVVFGDALSLPLSCRSTLSHFQSQRGCIKGPGFSPNQNSVLPVKPPPLPSRAEPSRAKPGRAGREIFYKKEPEWIESFAQPAALCAGWLDVKTGLFPASGSEKLDLLSVYKDYHYPSWCLALQSTLCRGVSQTESCWLTQNRNHYDISLTH